MEGLQEVRKVIVGVVCLLSLAATVVRAEVIDRVLAVVGGELIMLSDVNAARGLGLVATGTSSDPIRDVLNHLIDRELQLAEVERYAPREPTAEDVEREEQAVRARFPSEQAFQMVLASYGLDLERLRERLREDLRIRAYLDQRFPAANDRRQQQIDDWTTRLRRRGSTIDLYLVGG